ncbi:MAG: hypothetical protein IKO27_08455 [Ruminococcus sp.]|nr:hypothetical protein [Ruminococcus sp.]
MTSITRPTYYSHFAADSTMRRSAIIDFMQDCCTISRREDTAIGEMMISGEALLYVAYRQLDIISQAAYREKLTVQTGLFGAKRIYGQRVTEIIGEDGSLRARSYLVSTLVKASTRKPINLPKEINDSIVLCPAPDMELTPRKIIVPDCEPRRFEPFTALRCQADTNGHINNARYADLADELVPADANVTRARFEYKASFMPGDKIFPALYPTDTGAVMTLSNEAGLVCAVVEYCF